MDSRENDGRNKASNYPEKGQKKEGKAGRIFEEYERNQGNNMGATNAPSTTQKEPEKSFFLLFTSIFKTPLNPCNYCVLWHFNNEKERRKREPHQR